MLIVLGVAEIVRLILRFTHILPAPSPASEKAFIAAGFVCFAAILFFCIWGIVSATHVRSTSYEITLDKGGGKLEELNIALVADLHLGQLSVSVHQNHKNHYSSFSCLSLQLNK